MAKYSSVFISTAMLVCVSSCVRGQESVQVAMGAEEVVWGPIAAPVDSPFFSVSLGSGLITAFSANQITFSYTGKSLSSLSAGATALAPGPQGNFDECGAWLNSARLVRGRWIGWYHAERACDYSSGVTQKSVAYAESTDGQSWVKPRYPSNQVLTADIALSSDPNRSSVGDAHVLTFGDTLYMFYRCSSDWKVHVARSLVKDGGRPGTWWKYYNGAFTEPGLGGRSTAVDSDLVDTFIAYDSYLGRHIAVNFSGRWGAYLSLSVSSPLEWVQMPSTIYPLVSFPEDLRIDLWFGRGPADKQVYGYTSLVGLDGSENLGQEFYMYYMKLFDGETFSSRYQMRRRLKLTTGSTKPYAATVALTEYRRASDGTGTLMTEHPHPALGYSLVRNAGSILTYPQPGTSPVYSCYSPLTRSYFLSTSDPAQFWWANCDSVNDVFVRRVGWMSPVASTTASVPLYRCLDPISTRPFTSTDAACEGKQILGVLAYASMF